MTSKSKQPSPPKKPPAGDEDQLPAVPGSEIAIAAAFPGEKTEADHAAVEHLAAEITEYWMTSVTSILMVCKLCAEVAGKLDPLQRRELIDRLPFKESMFSKLASIGKNQALLDVNVQMHLPASWSIIYQLKDLTHEEAQRAISAKVLTPETTRAELNNWISKNSASWKDEKRLRRKPLKNADNDVLLHRLIKAFTGSTEIMTVWDECPRAVRRRFGRELAKLAP
jgi:hypothetical protein